MLQHERGYKGVKNDFGKNFNSINDRSVVIDFSNNSRVEQSYYYANITFFVVYCFRSHYEIYSTIMTLNPR
jgi:hypothetical protein